MIIYAGDIHGDVDSVASIDREAVKAGVSTVVQVGDFGWAWPGRECAISKYFQKRNRQGRPGPRWITCGGNHDNWCKIFAQESEQGVGLVELAPDCFYASRGSVHTIDGKAHIFMGGAESTDKHMRVEGISWWAEETPSYKEFSMFADNYENLLPEVVVAHDAPLRVNIHRHGREGQPTPRNFHNIMKNSGHVPRLYAYGHHHTLSNEMIDGTEFICCGLHGEFQSR
jgi:hypothetical protein